MDKNFEEFRENRLKKIHYLTPNNLKYINLTNKTNNISFQLTEKDLNKETGKKILSFFKKLENINFKIIKPLPRCLFGSKYIKIINKFNIPKNCYECSELFKILEDNKILFCTSKKEKNINYYKNKEEIYNEFKDHYNKLHSYKKCNTCIYKLRKQCLEPCTKYVLNKNDVLSLPKNLHISERKNKILLIEPETASWVIVEKKWKELLKNIKKPIEYKSLIKKFKDKRIERKLIQLYKAGLIKINNKQVISKNIFELKNKYPHLFILDTTTNCNLKCKYCYANSTPNGKNMKLEVMKRIVDKVLELPNEEFFIQLHGGEPFLNFENIKKIVEYGNSIAKSKNKTIRFQIQTNSILINKEIINFIKKNNNIGIGLSLDGPKEIHNKSRIYPNGKGSFDDVMKSIRLLRKNKIKFGVLAVIQNPENIEKIYKFFIKNKIYSFVLRNYFCQGRARYIKINQKEYALEQLKIFNKIIKNKDKEILDRNFGFIIKHIASRERPYMCMRSPCGAGNTILGFDVNGNIYPCREMGDKEEFKLCNIYDCKSLKSTLDSSKIIKKLRERTVDNISKCSSCYIKNFCGASCINESYNEFKNIYRESVFCKYYKYIFEELMWLLHDTTIKIKG